MAETNGEAVAGPSATAAAAEMLAPGSPTSSPRTSLDAPTPSGSAGDLSTQLERALSEKEHYYNQYRSLLGKLTAMRNTLGEKLKEDAEELDRRETAIHSLTEDNSALQASVDTLRGELESVAAEAAGLTAQLAQLKAQSDSSSADVLELRELRGEMERLRAEREDWEIEAGRERQRREAMEDEVRIAERREMEARSRMEVAEDERDRETERASNLQEVLSEFQQAKDSELRQATSELESQLKLAVSQLSEYKLRCANAESSLDSMANDASRSSGLEKAVKEKNAIIAKLRHDAVVTNEHLTEALRRLRKNASSDNVDRRLVTNILLSFLTTSRADSKRFEMLSLLSTILGWDDTEREKAGLQRSSNAPKPSRRKSSVQGERSAEEEAAMNESFSNLFVEFLLKEASQGQGDSPVSTTSPLPPRHSPGFSPPSSGTTTPAVRARTMSSSSSASGGSHSLDALIAKGRGPRTPGSSYRGSPHQ